MVLSGTAHEWEGDKKALPLSKICHTYPTMMTLGTAIHYLKKIQYMNHVTHLFSSADIHIFHQKSATFVISRFTDKGFILIHNF